MIVSYIYREGRVNAERRGWCTSSVVNKEGEVVMLSARPLAPPPLARLTPKVNTLERVILLIFPVLTRGSTLVWFSDWLKSQSEERTMCASSLQLGAPPVCNFNLMHLWQVANWRRTLSPLYKAPNQFWVSDTNISGFVRCWDFQPSPIYSDFLWKIPSYGPLKKTAPSQRGSFSRPTT